MCEGDTFRNLDNPCHMFESLGLNLAYKELLLGIWAKGPTRLPQTDLYHTLEASLRIEQTPLASVVVAPWSTGQAAKDLG
jgi:hypothetical protein